MSDDKKVSNVLYMWKHCAICLAYLWVVAFLCLPRTYLIIMTERPPLWERGLVECQQRNPIMITRRTRRRRNKMHRFNSNHVSDFGFLLFLSRCKITIMSLIFFPIIFQFKRVDPWDLEITNIIYNFLNYIISLNILYIVLFFLNFFLWYNPS